MGAPLSDAELNAALRDAGAELAAMGRFLHARGWSPATSSNYSLRLGPELVAITVSGRHKELLTPEDVMAVDLEGTPRSPGKPSAETALHLQLYRRRPELGAVLHTHSAPATVITLARPAEPALAFSGYELQKAIAGVRTHEGLLRLPVFDNTQEMEALAREVAAELDLRPATPGYLIRGHGLYTWGRTLLDAKRHVEALEFLLVCRLERMKLGLAPHPRRS